MDEKLWKVLKNDGECAVLVCAQERMEVWRPSSGSKYHFEKEFSEGDVKAQSWIDRFHPS